MTDQQRAAAAVQYLIDSATEIAAAKAEMIKADHMRTVVRAMAIRQSTESTVGAREAEALTSDAYKEALYSSANAAQAYEELRARREAAHARIDYWRSLNANQRVAERGYQAHG